jgi:hypothetical protein
MHLQGVKEPIEEVRQEQGQGQKINVDELVGK